MSVFRKNTLGYQVFIVFENLTLEAILQTVYEITTLQWRHNGRDSVSNHQPHHGLLSRLFRRKLKKTSKVRVTGLCAGNSPVTGEFPAQMASNAENVSIWWRHHDPNVLHDWIIKIRIKAKQFLRTICSAWSFVKWAIGINCSVAFTNMD